MNASVEPGPPVGYLMESSKTFVLLRKELFVFYDVLFAHDDEHTLFPTKDLRNQRDLFLHLGSVDAWVFIVTEMLVTKSKKTT